MKMKRDRWKKYWSQACRARKEAEARQYGSQGAASEGRHIDPATLGYRPTPPKPANAALPPLVAEQRRRGLEEKANALLYGKHRFGKKAPEEVPALSRAQRKRKRRKQHNESKHRAESKHRRERWRMAREMAAANYSVEGTEDGQCYVLAQGQRVAGPFANAEAWSWVDRHTVARRYGA